MFLLHSSKFVSASVKTDSSSFFNMSSVLNKSKFEVTPSIFLNMMDSCSQEFLT